jgi:hypothetical protein
MTTPRTTFKKDDRVRVKSDDQGAQRWLRDLHGREGVVVRDDGFAARVQFVDDSFARINHMFLELVEAAAPAAGPRRVVVNAPDGQTLLHQFHHRHGLVTDWDEREGWCRVDLDPVNSEQPAATIMIAESFLLDETDPIAPEVRVLHDLPMLRNGDTLSITETATLGIDGPDKTDRRADPSKLVGQRYWRYDPDNDQYTTIEHDWIKGVWVSVGRSGVRMFPERELNPGASRWLGNRLIEAAAIFEMLVADQPERELRDSPEWERELLSAQTAEAEGEPSITQAELLAAFRAGGHQGRKGMGIDNEHRAFGVWLEKQQTTRGRAGDHFEPGHDFTEGGRPGGSLHE